MTMQEFAISFRRPLRWSRLCFTKRQQRAFPLTNTLEHSMATPKKKLTDLAKKSLSTKQATEIKGGRKLAAPSAVAKKGY